VADLKLYRRAAVMSLIAVLVLSACQSRTQRVYFNGNFYPSKARADKQDRKNFVVSVRRADQELLGAREAGRYEGTQYCLKNFGTSDIAWTVGPDPEDEDLEVSGGSLILRGACVTW